MILWNLVKGPQKNAEHRAYTNLNSFAGENSITISDMNFTLDKHKAKVLVLQDQLKQQMY